MGLFHQFKSLLLVHLVIGYIFVMSGLIVTFLMLCSCIIWPFNRHLYRKVCVHLAYSHWSQMTFLAQWWSGMDISMYMKDEDLPYIGQEHILCVMNHKYDIDWLVAWALSERFQMLGNTKIYGKQILKYVPLIGWAWYFTESIFLKREWEHDEKIIQKDLQQATDYPEGYYVTNVLMVTMSAMTWCMGSNITSQSTGCICDYLYVYNQDTEAPLCQNGASCSNKLTTITLLVPKPKPLLLFPEGTRFTEDKHRASLEICKTKGYPLLKHVLLPRPKGFVTSVRGLKGHFPTILNSTVGFSSDGYAPTLMNVLSGRSLSAHFHAERIPIDSVPMETDEECADWLRQLFKRKDDLFDGFLQTGKFPGPVHKIPRRINDLVMWLFWAVLTCVPLFVYLGRIFLSGTLFHQSLVVGVVVILSVIVRLMIGVTEIRKGSSYGKGSNGEDKKSQ